MAPRTREQQDAYNEKRRTEAVVARTAKAAPKGKAPAKAKAKANGHAKPKVMKDKRTAAPPVEMEPTGRKEKKPKAKELASPFSEEKMKAVFKGEAKVSGLVPMQQAKLPGFTMAGSYVRKTGAGKGKLRNGTHQCTVAFTTEQMNWLVAKAGFKLVSLAEMIRICVVERMARPDGSST